MIFLIRSFSRLPFSVLHAVSRLLYLILYRVFAYRVRVVRENLERSFPELSDSLRMQIERQFFRNFCDTLIESLKYITISKEDFQKRIQYQNLELAEALYQQGKNVVVLTSHLGNWDALGIAAAMGFPHENYGVYQPLSNPTLDQLILHSRGRFGLKLISIKRLKGLWQRTSKQPFVAGLMADQAPQQYSKCFRMRFLNQDTYVTPGPGILCAEHDMVPVWVGLRRTGRSQFALTVEPLQLQPDSSLSAEEAAQIAHFAQLKNMSEDKARDAFLIMKLYNQKLESCIRAQPADWLWSHRRWKTRSR